MKGVNKYTVHNRRGQEDWIRKVRDDVEKANSTEVDRKRFLTLMVWCYHQNPNFSNLSKLLEMFFGEANDN